MKTYMNKHECIVLLICALIASIGCSGDKIPFVPSDPLMIMPDAMDNGFVGTDYSVTISVSQYSTPVGEVSINNGSLPPGLTISHNSHDDIATITGIPLTEGVYSFDISVWCYGTNSPGQTASKSYSIAILSQM